MSNLPLVYTVEQHPSGWWVMKDTIRNEIVDGQYFKTQAEAQAEADWTNEYMFEDSKRITK